MCLCCWVRFGCLVDHVFITLGFVLVVGWDGFGLLLLESCCVSLWLGCGGLVGYFAGWFALVGLIVVCALVVFTFVCVYLCG